GLEVAEVQTTPPPPGEEVGHRPRAGHDLEPAGQVVAGPERHHGQRGAVRSCAVDRLVDRAVAPGDQQEIDLAVAGSARHVPGVAGTRGEPDLQLEAAVPQGGFEGRPGPTRPPAAGHGVDYGHDAWQCHRLLSGDAPPATPAAVAEGADGGAPRHRSTPRPPLPPARSRSRARPLTARRPAPADVPTRKRWRPRPVRAPRPPSACGWPPAPRRSAH